MTILTAARRRRDLTQGQLADLLGTSASTVSRIEKGKRIPNRNTARALYELYKGEVSLGAIYDPLFAEETAA